MVGFGRENQLFDCAPQAWVNGPVYPEIYHIYKDMVPGMCDHLKMSNFVADGDDPAVKEKLLLDKWAWKGRDSSDRTCHHALWVTNPEPTYPLDA